MIVVDGIDACLFVSPSGSGRFLLPSRASNLPFDSLNLFVTANIMCSRFEWEVVFC